MGGVLVGKDAGLQTHAGLGLTRPSSSLLWVPQNCPAFRGAPYNQGIICRYQNLEQENNFPSQSLQRVRLATQGISHMLPDAPTHASQCCWGGRGC